MGKKLKSEKIKKKIPKMADKANHAGEQEDMIFFEDSNSKISEDIALIPLPDTPMKPLSKKSKREDSHSVNEDILAAISKFSLKHDATFQKVSVIEKTTQATSKELDKLSTTVKQLVAEVGENKKELSRLQNEVHMLQKDNTALKKALIETQRYGWRSFLKLHGLKEQAGEDVRGRVIEVLQQVATDLPANNLNAGVDVVHRLGPPPKDAKCRSIIIRFSFRRVRDAIW